MDSTASRPGLQARGRTGVPWDLAAAFASPAATARAVLGQLRAELGFRWWAVTRLTRRYLRGAVHRHRCFCRGRSAAGVGRTRCADGGSRKGRRGSRRTSGPCRPTATLRWPEGGRLGLPQRAAERGRHLAVRHRVRGGPRPAARPGRRPVAASGAASPVASTVFATDLRFDQAHRRAERAEADALLERLTGLANRRGWQLLLDREEQRCRRYGSVASVLIVDLDGLKAVKDRGGHGRGHPAAAGRAGPAGGVPQHRRPGPPGRR